MSATPAETIVEAQWISEKRALARVRSEQCIYSIFARAVEAAVFPTARRYGVGVMVYGPLNSGWLTGKYVPDAPPPEGSRGSNFWAASGRWDAGREPVQRKYALLEELRALAGEAGLSLTHLAMAFAIEHPAVSAAIIGPRTLAHLEDLLAGADVRLSADVLERIDALVPPGERIDARDLATANPALEDPAERRR